MLSFRLTGLRFYSQKTSDVVGFIGLGNMGKFMAKNLIKKGTKVAVYDINDKVVQEFVSQGAIKASSPAEVGKLSKRIVTMLPNSPHVVETYNAILPVASSGTFMIDCSTIDPATARDLAKKAQQHGVTAIDAPVSGGVGGAEAGTLTFMIGGSDDSFQKAKEILEKMGKNIVHCGGNGNGQVAKICNNLLLAIGMIGTSEAMNLGVKLGMDPKILASVINTSSGRCWSSEVYNPYPGVVPTSPASRNYEGGFGASLMWKDLQLAKDANRLAYGDQNTSNSLHPHSPMTFIAEQLYGQLTQTMGNKDFSSVRVLLEQITKK